MLGPKVVRTLLTHRFRHCERSYESPAMIRWVALEEPMEGISTVPLHGPTGFCSYLEESSAMEVAQCD
jgi:hypothetical protein